jgi:phosphate transport system protein
MTPQHTDSTYDSALEKLRSAILEMGGLVEEQIVHGVHALTERDDALARETIHRDHTVNRFDVEIDDLAIKLLALYQPAAGDLRLITTALKITTDLERIGDLAAHIAERAVELSHEPAIESGVDLLPMAEVARDMVHRALDAFVREDTDMALEVCATDDHIDRLHREIFGTLVSRMGSEPENIASGMRLLFVSKYLERVGDHATNIAEMVIFMVKGQSIRHLDTLPRQL